MSLIKPQFEQAANALCHVSVSKRNAFSLPEGTQLTESAKVFKLGIGNDLEISYKLQVKQCGVERSRVRVNNNTAWV